MGTRTRKGSSTLFILFTLLLLNSPSAQAISNPIKTVVVLVMENRSFDHMLGWMKKLNPAINGVTGSESNRVSVTDPKSQQFFFKSQAQYVDPDPGHSFQAIREQIFGSNDTSADPAPMNGFAQQAYSMDNTTGMSQNVMNGFDPDMVAVYKTLVSEFAVFDRSRIRREEVEFYKKRPSFSQKRLVGVIVGNRHRRRGTAATVAGEN